MSLQSLPVGAQSFADIIKGDVLYVDKTRDIYNLVCDRGVYFLSRPRRFGKSLLISTLDSIFRGQKELFEDLWIGGSDYSWQEYPVVRLDFSRIGSKSGESVLLQLKLKLVEIAKEYGLVIDEDLDVHSYFDKIFVELGKQGRKAAVLIDEYDKPIIDNIDEPEKAEEIRLLMRNFYTIIKAQDANIRFVLLTGVSKFAKMSIFSGLNNLYDLSVDNNYANLLGYTQSELESYFDAYIDELAKVEALSKQETLDKIKLWYNGYRFANRAKEGVYNPFSTLSLFKGLDFRDYWFETGTPTFLIKMMRRESFNIADEDNFIADALSLSIFEIEKIDPTVLLYQAGYLTIESYDKEFDLLKLKFPNYEVKKSFLKLLLCGYSNVERKLAGNQVAKILQCLEQGDLEVFFEHVGVFLSNVPYDINIDHEKYYQTIFYCILHLLGVHIEVEVSTNRGRMDAVIHARSCIYVIEFKLNGTKEEALQQIKDKGYAEKYKADGRPITLIGVEFDKDMRNILDSGWVVEEC